MPATYAHYRFGQEVRKDLPEKEKKIVEEFPELFMIGLHGPDIFLGRMMMCRKAAEILGLRFRLTANGSKIL